MKHEILEKLTETIYNFRSFPSDEDFQAVATALIQKHPCLKEPGPFTGCNG